MSRRARNRAGHRAYRPRPAATNAIEIAISRARKLSDADVEQQMRLVRAAVAGMCLGVKNAQCDQWWRSLADTANMTETLAAMGLGSGPDADHLIEAAQRTPHDVHQRHTQRGTWTLFADEIASLHWLASLHETQLTACSYGEFEQAYRRTADRLAQARAGNAAPGAIVIEGDVRELDAAPT